MGWSNSTFQLLIISASPSGFSGLFVYSPAPGPGKLVASIASTVGTDPYGNAYLSGVTTYGTLGSFAELLASALKLQDTSANLWQISAVVVAMHSYIQFQAAPARGSVFLNASGSFVAQQPGNFGVPEIWHVIGSAGEPAFGAGFGAAGFVGAVAPAFQFEPINGGRARLRGDVALTANQVQGAGIVTLPAGYQTATVQQFFTTPNNLSGFSTSTGSIVALAAGVIAINCAGTNGNFVSLDGIVIELD